MKRIGSIYACIAGDHRYGTTIEAHADAKAIEIRLISTGAVGGMDGPGGSYTNPSEVLERIERTKLQTDVQKLLSALRRQFKKADAGTIAGYGKPRLNFAWHYEGTTRKGLNAAHGTRALKDANEEPVAPVEGK